MYHKVIVVGYLGRDPEMRYTADGTPVTNFSLATTQKKSGSDGSQIEETVWFRVTCWRRSAEIANQYLKKGRMVLVEGRMQPDKETGGPRIWTSQDGKPRASYEITADAIKFIGGRGEGGGSDAGSGGGRAADDFDVIPPDDDNIPF